MSSIGPQLPPHLAKRKRSPDDESPDSPPPKATRLPNNNQDEIALGDSDSEDDGYGPSAPQAPAAIGPTMPSSAAAPARPSIGPALPPSAAAASNSDSESDDTSGPAPPPPTAAAAAAPPPPKRAIRGPAPPPASLAERPNSPPSPSPSSSSSSEDEYGPALPGAARTSSHQIHPSMRPNAAAADPEPDIPRRDDWMLAPPSAEPGYRERDPTKLRSRKFASGATATTRPRDGSGGISSIWTETPEEKARRLADAVLGRGGAGGERSQQQQQSSSGGGAAGVSGIGNKRGGGGGSGDGGSHRDEKIRAFTEQTRGKSLYEEHQSARKAGKSNAGGARKGGGEADEEDDDPSKRAFDREKDMGLGMKIDASKRKELLNRAADFGGRFSKGNYL